MNKFVIGIAAVALTATVSAIGGAVAGVSKVCKCSTKEAGKKLKTAFLGEEEKEGTAEEIKEEN